MVLPDPSEWHTPSPAALRTQLGTLSPLGRNLLGDPASTLELPIRFVYHLIMFESVGQLPETGNSRNYRFPPYVQHSDMKSGKKILNDKVNPSTRAKRRGLFRRIGPVFQFRQRSAKRRTFTFTICLLFFLFPGHLLDLPLSHVRTTKSYTLIAFYSRGRAFLAS